MRSFPLNQRKAEDTGHTADVEVALLIIRHPLLPQPVRLSSDNKVALSPDRRVRGTRSSWFTPGGEPFLHVIGRVEVPDQPADGGKRARVTVIDRAGLLTPIIGPALDDATADMAVVMSSAPDILRGEWLGMVFGPSSVAASEFSFELTVDPILDESYPSARMTRDRCPGLF